MENLVMSIIGQLVKPGEEEGREREIPSNILF
jgi:hypothetical protein